MDVSAAQVGEGIHQTGGGTQVGIFVIDVVFGDANGFFRLAAVVAILRIGKILLILVGQRFHVGKALPRWEFHVQQ